MANSKLTPGSIIPDLPINGEYERFAFNLFNPLAKFQLHSRFVPTSISDSSITIESRNYLFSGFRWLHITQDVDANPFGVFKFQSFIGDDAGVDIFDFDGTDFNFYSSVDMGGNKITNLATPTNATDAVSKSYVDGIAIGTITLTGDVTGSGTAGTPFATTIVSTLNNIPVATGAVNINSQNIISVGKLGIGVASPINLLEFPGTVGDCKICLWRGVGVTDDFQVFGFGITASTLKYSVNASSSNHVFYCGASSTTSTELFRISGNGTSNFSGNLGIGVPAPTLPLQFPNTVSNCKICLYQSGSNSFQVFGFGITASTLKYTVDAPASSHVFYCGASSTTSTELFRIAGTGYATVSGGSGTFYSRVPSIQISRSGGIINTALTSTMVKLNMSGSFVAPGAVQFTSTANRITYTGSHLGTACFGMVSASVRLTLSALTAVNLTIYKNGSVIASTSAWGANPTTTIPISVVLATSMVSLSPGDYLEVWASSTPNATSATDDVILSFHAC